MKNSDKLHKPVTSILRNPHFNSDGTVEGYSQFTPEVFEQEGFNHAQEHQKWEERTTRQLNYYNRAKDKTKYKIPPITHSVYLTSDENPNPMKDLYIDNYGKTSQRLSAEDSDFTHYLWVNFDPNDPKYKDVIPEEIRSIPNLQISNIREFEGHPLYHNTVDFLENGRAASKFVEASDLVRVMAMEAKGGLYHDLDWKLYDAKEMIRYMKNFDFIGGREGEEWTSSIGNAMFAAKAEHPVVRKLSQLIDRNLNEKDPDLLPDYIKYPQREFDRIISNSGPIAITMAYNLAGNKGTNRDLICPSKILYNADYARSHQTGDYHNPEELKHSWNNYMPIKTIGGDQFSGNWGHSYQEPIKYNKSDLGVKDKNEGDLGVKDKNEGDELNKAVEHGNKEMFDALLPRVNHEPYLGAALEKVVEHGNKEMFDALLPRITTQHYLADALYKAVEQGNKKMFYALIAKVNVIYLEGTFIRVVEKYNKEMFEALLPSIDSQDYLSDALDKAVEKYNKEMFEALLPRITNQRYLSNALDKAVEQGNKEMFYALISRVNHEPYLGAAFKKIVEHGNKEMFDALLPRITNQHYLGAAFKKVVEDGNKEMFDALIPRVNVAYLEEIFSRVVEKDRKEMFEALLPRITNQDSLDDAFNKAVEHGNKDMFETLLPRVNVVYLEKMFSRVVEKDRKEMFEALLPRITNQDSLDDGFNKAVEHGNKDMFEALLPRITNQDILDKGFKKAVEHARQEMFDALLPKVTNQSILNDAFVEAVDHINLEVIKALSPRITEHGDIMESALKHAFNHAAEYRREDILDELLPRMNDDALDEVLPRINDQEMLNHMFYRVIQENQQEKFDALLPKITHRYDLDRALRIAIEKNQQVRIDKLMAKVNDHALIYKALDKVLVDYNQDIFNRWLPKLINGDNLEYYISTLLSTAVEVNNKEVCDKLLPKVFDILLPKSTSYLSAPLLSAVKFGRKEMFDALLPKITSQRDLGYALTEAVKTNNQKMFDALLPRITKQQSLDYSLNVAKERNIPNMVDAIQNYDPLKAPNVVTPDVITASASSNSVANDIPAIGDKSQAPENQVTQASDGRFADTINHKIFMGTAALAVVMKSLGQDIGWAKPILGGGAAKVETSFEPIDLEPHINPEYDYSALLKAETKKAPPLEKAALERVAELAQSEEASDLSKEQWKKLIKDDEKLKVFLEVALEKAKLREANALPVTKSNLRGFGLLPKPREKRRQR